jgi:hypothetical protein
MYPHMEIFDAEHDGDDNKDSYNEDDLDLYVNHQYYMQPHVHAHVPQEIQNIQTKNNPNPGTPEEQDENELLEAAVYTSPNKKR